MVEETPFRRGQPHDDGDAAPSTESTAEPSAREQFRDGLGQAARNAGIGAVAPGEVPSASALLAAVGGVRGLVESILPGLGFLIVYTATGEVVPSVLAPLAVALIFVAARAMTRSMVTPAIAGLVGIGVSAALALLTGRAEDNFVPGLIVNAVSVTVLLASIAFRWPAIGVIVGLLANEPSEWRGNRAKRRVFTVATWLWVGLFSARLLVQAPLYFAEQTEALAATKLVMGVPLYAGMLWVTWLLVRTVYKGDSDAAERRASGTP
ncbi:DUF3159 domain-containing protein [Salinibacterium sp. SYSU T00001]|uniref:DUF3159 domain-containing protein n=1 Tax=Homoserinimonas sedimenticola TaxID=2986805 RepID=UPI0022367ABF|nr:DUF3159 domain-containing protein [Salinibacterium sedimenticola]MCW4384497.1 DUF3159 domain-containing protein [Salinibacterium sedimenticola]